MRDNPDQPKALLTHAEIQELCGTAYFVRRQFESLLYYAGRFSDLVAKIDRSITTVQLSEDYTINRHALIAETTVLGNSFITMDALTSYGNLAYLYSYFADCNFHVPEVGPEPVPDPDEDEDEVGEENEDEDNASVDDCLDILGF